MVFNGVAVLGEERAVRRFFAVLRRCSSRSSKRALKATRLPSNPGRQHHDDHDKQRGPDRHDAGPEDVEIIDYR